MPKTFLLAAVLLAVSGSPSFAQAGRAATARSTKAAAQSAERYWLSAGLTRLAYGSKSAHAQRPD